MAAKKPPALIPVQPLPESEHSLSLSSRATNAPISLSPRQSVLRQTRMDELMESCRHEILRQIIGPFGLTPAMFEDKNGGNVTTTYNFEKGPDFIATEEDRNRHEQWQADYDRRSYDDDKKIKRTARLKDHDTAIISAYTGNELPRNGQMHLDHVVPVKKIEDDPRANLFMTRDQRVAMANSPRNLMPAEQSINCSMADKDKMEWAKSKRKEDPGKTNAESFGIDESLLQQTHKTGQQHVARTVLTNQIKKQGGELMTTGVQEAKHNALRQALGVLIYEFVNGSFIELKHLFRERNQDNLIDRIVQSLKRVMQRVASRLKAALDAAISGGIQGFISNLLTFLINNFITTAKKVVTLIRESMKSLWEAIKIVVSPPAGMSGMDVARHATKIVSAAVVTALGILLEESVKGFLLGFPFLAPIVNVLSLALTAILTGITGALVIYCIDRLFDWLSATDTETLEILVSNLRITNESVKRIAEDQRETAKISRNIETIRQETQSNFDDFDKILG